VGQGDLASNTWGVPLECRRRPVKSLSSAQVGFMLLSHRHRYLAPQIVAPASMLLSFTEVAFFLFFQKQSFKVFILPLAGPLYISVASPSGACPPTNWSLVSFNGASFVGPPASNPSVLSVSPPDIVARVQTLATVTISDLTVNLTSVPMNSTVTVPASKAQAVSVNQTWEIGNALASVVVLGGAPSLSDLRGASTSVDGVGTLTSLDEVSMEARLQSSCGADCLSPHPSL
jgi:hypothetical protein